MNARNLTLIGVSFLLALCAATPAQDAPVDPRKFFVTLIGTWEGTCRTWLQPDKLHDESAITGEFQFVLGNHIVRHAYLGSMRGKPRTGEETIAFDSTSKKYQIAWFDEFHTNNAILFSEGDPTPTGFTVTCEYSAGPGRPAWHWRTVYELIDDDHLTIIAYNTPPGGKEAKAVETVYTRTKR